MTSGLGADSRFLALRTAGSPHAGPMHLGTGTCAGGTIGQGAQRTVPAGQLGAGGAVSLFSTHLRRTRNVFYFLIKNKSSKGSLKEVVLLKNQNHFVFRSRLPILHHMFAKTPHGSIRMSQQCRRAGWGCGPGSLRGPHPGWGGGAGDRGSQPQAATQGTGRPPAPTLVWVPCDDQRSPPCVLLGGALGRPWFPHVTENEHNFKRAKQAGFLK